MSRAIGPTKRFYVYDKWHEWNALGVYDELRHLLLIVEHGTFTEAARHAHLSQPALSASVRRLEAEFGARLLHRGRDGARLTAAGEALVPRVRASLAALEDGRRAVAEVMGLRAGEVRLGAGTTATTYLLPPVLARYRQEHPEIRYLLRETTTAEGLVGLERGELDLAVVTAEGHEPWVVDELILVAAPGWRAKASGGRRRRAGSDAAPREAMPFVTLRHGTTTRAMLSMHFPEADIVMELGSLAGLKGNVRAGIGMALVSRHAVVADLRARRLVRIRDPRTPIERPMMLAHRGVESLPPAVAALRKLLLSDEGREHLRRRG
jgi:DNA-binding transcriptional LysR family regulator